MNDFLFIIGLAICFFLFAGDPDFHDLVMEKLSQDECISQPVESAP